ncbi:unnamed protein product [Gongylonema pulchrum]|uniref:Secreted protein n=1 Tax=Gongylonema pulchrum TaxID=637853 RepID=A0A183EE12_9BILA|nr:unnamed protein product [Gongylonema pulchrum]
MPLLSFMWEMFVVSEIFSIQVLTTTNGDEKCRLVQPWLHGSHHYSWFFSIDRWPYSASRQAANQTVAALIILPPNDCHSIC